MNLIKYLMRFNPISLIRPGICSGLVILGLCLTVPPPTPGLFQQRSQPAPILEFKGQVVDQADRPVPGVDVFVLPERSPEVSRKPERFSKPAATTGEDGRFTAKLLRGTYIVYFLLNRKERLRQKVKVSSENPQKFILPFTQPTPTPEVNDNPGANENSAGNDNSNRPLNNNVNRPETLNQNENRGTAGPVNQKTPRNRPESEQPAERRQSTGYSPIQIILAGLVVLVVLGFVGALILFYNVFAETTAKTKNSADDWSGDDGGDSGSGGELEGNLESADPPVVGGVLTGDEVNCTLYTPSQVKPDKSFFIQVFAHLPSQAKEIEAMAKTTDRQAEEQKIIELENKIRRGSALTFELRIPDFEIHEIQSRIWQGRILEIPFMVRVSESCSGMIIVSQDSAPIGRMGFTIEVGAEEKQISPPVKMKNYKYAFISYSSADRPKVLERVQMLNATSIDYFQDILKIEPGEEWEKKLYEEIDKSDVFYLFWSKAASESKWIQKEILYARARQGTNNVGSPDIIPIIIEGPPPVPPPESLNFLHFNDKFVYFIYAAQAENQLKKEPKDST